MKKGLIIVLAVIVAAVLVAAIIWMRDDGENSTSTTTTPPASVTPENEQSETNNNESSEQLTIRYDGSSFTPNTLTIQQGDTVTFVNGSSTLVWPASDDHPVHDELSGFDALKGLTEGEEYSFTFNEAGEWGYHNHLASTEGGTIVVE